MSSRAIARLGDSSDHGAAIVSTNQDGTVFCEGAEVAVAGATLAPHSDHSPLTINGNLATKLFINSKAVVLNGSITGCGASVIAGATKTFGT